MPSVADGRQVIENLIRAGSGGKIRLVSFRKTNHQAGEVFGTKVYALEYSEVFGTKVYALEYSVEIEFLENGWTGGALDLEGDKFSFRTGEPGPLDFFLYTGMQRVRKGERRTVTGTLSFEKTERGWMGPDGVVIRRRRNLQALRDELFTKPVPANAFLGTWQGSLNSEVLELLLEDYPAPPNPGDPGTYGQRAAVARYARIEESSVYETREDGTIVLRGTRIAPSRRVRSCLHTLHGRLSEDRNSISGTYVDACGSRGTWSVSRQP